MVAPAPVMVMGAVMPIVEVTVMAFPPASVQLPGREADRVATVAVRLGDRVGERPGTAGVAVRNGWSSRRRPVLNPAPRSRAPTTPPTRRAAPATPVRLPQ